MSKLKIFDLIGKRVLVTRGSARGLASNLAASLIEGQGEVTIDLSEVEGITPSFLDEMLSVLEECGEGSGQERFRATIVNPPTQLSSKFAAVGRGHGLAIEETEEGIWTISGVKQKPVLGR